MAESASGVSEALTYVAARLRRKIFLRALMHGSVIASVLSIGAIVIDRTAVLLIPLFASLATFYALALVYAMAYSFVVSLTPFDVARVAEEALGLRERLSSAIALADNPQRIDATFYGLQLRDANAIARRLFNEDVVSINVRRNAFWILITLALVVACWLMVPSSNASTRSLDTIEHLEAHASRIERELPAGSPVRARTEQMRSIAHAMRNGISPGEAARRMRALSAQTAMRQRELAGSSRQESASDAQHGRDTTATRGREDQSHGGSVRSEGGRESLERRALGEIRRTLDEAARELGDSNRRQNIQEGRPQAKSDNGVQGESGSTPTGKGEAARSQGSEMQQRLGESALRSPRGAQQAAGGSGRVGRNSRVGQQPDSENIDIGSHGISAPYIGASRRIAGYNPANSLGYDKVLAPLDKGVRTESHETGQSSVPAGSSRSTVPYSGIYSAARKTAETAILHEDIPPAYKRTVESYFRGIAPASRKQ